MITNKIVITIGQKLKLVQIENKCCVFRNV